MNFVVFPRKIPTEVNLVGTITDGFVPFNFPAMEISTYVFLATRCEYKKEERKTRWLVEP